MDERANRGDVGLPEGLESNMETVDSVVANTSADLRVITYKCLFFFSLLSPPCTPHISVLQEKMGLDPRGPGFCHVTALTSPSSEQ